MLEGSSLLQDCSARPWRLVHNARILAELQRTIEQVTALAPALMATVLDMLNELPDGQALCHFDFHPDQVLITSHGPVMIDWMTAMRGDPLADVARTAIILSASHPPHGGWPQRATIRLWRKLFYQTYITRYLRLQLSTSYEQIRRWMIPVAAARLAEGIPGEETYLLKLVQSSLHKQTASA